MALSKVFRKIFKTPHLQKRENPLSIEIEGQIELTPPIMIDANTRNPHFLIRQFWWVVVFVSICSLVYSHATNKKDRIIASLDEHLNHLAQEKINLLQEKEDLLLQINSQSDPAWIQLTLMKGLGLVPEGQMKVYFYNE